MIILAVDWLFASLKPSIPLIAQEDGGFLSQFDLPTMLILIGIVVLLFAVIGRRIRRIAVIEFFEPDKEEKPEKAHGILGMWEQITLGLLGLFLLGFGLAWKFYPPISVGENQEPGCYYSGKETVIRIQRFDKTEICKCQVEFYPDIQIDRPHIQIAGFWFNRPKESQLWALLIDESEN